MRLAVDAMGGDHAPRELVAGAVDAARQDDSLEVLLVGREEEIRAELDALGVIPSGVSIVHASQVISMDDKPVEALKSRPDSSILRAMQLVAQGDADAAIAAGSTGAAVAAATMCLKRLPGVRRPGIAVPFPARNQTGVALLIDAGANPNCRPHHLMQYAVMGANYFESVWGVKRPRVGLVSIGEEESKGTAFIHETRAMIRGTDVNFVGNVEGRGLFGGDIEVAVADGFVGNIILKSAQGVAELLLGHVKRVLGDGDPRLFRSIAKNFDYAEFGGAPLLGVDGTVIVCHGRSDRRAIANAILVGARAVAGQVNAHIVAGLAGSTPSD